MSSKHQEHHEYGMHSGSDFAETLKLNYELFEKRTKQFIDSLNIQKDWHILDVGAGSGIVSNDFLKKLEEGSGTLTLMEPLDCFESLLQNIAAQKDGKVLYKKCTIEDKTYQCEHDPEGYDLIFIRLVLHHCDAKEALNCLTPFLKSNGVLAIQEFAPGSAGFYKKGLPCEKLNSIEMLSAKSLAHHAMGEKYLEYLPPPMYKNILREKWTVEFEEKYVEEDHPKSLLGNLVFKMISKSCKDEKLLEEGKSEFDSLCQDPDSVVYSRIHIHIVARKK